MGTITFLHEKKKGVSSLLGTAMLFLIVGHSIFYASGFTFGSGDKESGAEKAENYTGEVRKYSGRLDKQLKGGKTVKDQRGGIDDNYYDSVIYSDIYFKKTHGEYYQEVVANGKKSIILDAPATRLAKIAAEQEKKIAEEKKKAKEAAKKPIRYFTGGYCRTLNGVEISKSSEFMTLSCLLDFGRGGYRRADVLIGVYPDYKREIVIGLPIYVTFSNGNRAAFNGIVMRADKSSINMADWVDSARIRKLVAESGLAINDVAYRYASAYMSALNASKTHQELSYVYVNDQNGSNTGVAMPVQTTNVEPPRASDYFIAAGIEIFSKLLSIGGKEYLYSTNPLFRVYSGKRVWVEGIVDFDTKSIFSRYGNMASEERQKSIQNNMLWNTEKQQIIQQYQHAPTSNGFQYLMQPDTGGGSRATPIVLPASSQNTGK